MHVTVYLGSEARIEISAGIYGGESCFGTQHRAPGERQSVRGSWNQAAACLTTAFYGTNKCQNILFPFRKKISTVSVLNPFLKINVCQRKIHSLLFRESMNGPESEESCCFPRGIKTSSYLLKWQTKVTAVGPNCRQKNTESFDCLKSESGG